MSVAVLDLLATQWRVGFGGPVGLDYGAIRPTVRMAGLQVGSWPNLLDDLRTLEAAALRAMNGTDDG